MAPMLSFEDMPVHCVVRPPKVKRDLEEERHSDLGSALQGVCLAEDENMVSSYSFVSPWRYQFQGSKSATPILAHHEHRPGHFSLHVLGGLSSFLDLVGMLSRRILHGLQLTISNRSWNKRARYFRLNNT
jgi:hypothetical protein